MKKIGEYAGEVAAKRMKDYVDSYCDQLVSDVIKKLAGSGHHGDHEEFHDLQIHIDRAPSPTLRASVNPASTVPALGHALTPVDADVAIAIVEEAAALAIEAAASLKEFESASSSFTK